MLEAAGPWARGAKEAEGWVGGTLGAKGRTVWAKSRRLVPLLSFGEFPSFLAVASYQKLPGKAGQQRPARPCCLPLPVAPRGPSVLLIEEKGQGSGTFEPSATLSEGLGDLCHPVFHHSPRLAGS